MTSRARYNPLTFQVTLTVLALAAFSLAMVIGFGFFATLKADRDSLEKQKIFVTNGIADEIAAVVRQQTERYRLGRFNHQRQGRQPDMDGGKSRRMDVCLLRP